ncbi:hypothetical protein [Sulfuracidifex tepidarius]|uniref:Uncharacterized protein n=1 Tax=Sulfuracidifex tepidarius TaxID=1294262 RepID=A0A510E0E5_9CREN|nr:hypothetical protein [Sulfuracidifex tepidarius]BBG25954.1 hypothetical protein IC007_0459 [Sulfuracidifex tepidarius]
MNLLTVKKLLLKESLSPLQQAQLYYIHSIFTDILAPIICNYDNLNEIGEQINDIEKFYLGLPTRPSTIYEKISIPLYAINRFFISSSGPRFGSIYEDLIKGFLENSGYSVETRVNIYQFPLFSSYRSGHSVDRKVIDFIAKKDDKFYLIEQRTSEHSGGRTGQESLLDKFNSNLGSEGCKAFP